MKSLAGSFNYFTLFAPDVKKRWKFYVIVALAMMALSGLSYAQEATSGFAVLDKIDNAFKPFQTTWYNAIKGYAVDLFWKLALLDFLWTTISWVMEKQELPDLLHGLARKIFTLGFFFALLQFSGEWIPAIIDSLRSIGENVGNVKATPDGILFKGFEVATGMFKLINKLGVSEKLALAIPVAMLAVVIFLAYAFVAATLLITLIESYIAIGAGVILLGFGGSRWTTEFATKYLQFAFGTGMKLMVIYLVVGAGQTIVNGMQIDSNNLVQSMFVMLGTVFVYAYLVIQIPGIVSGMMSGSPALSTSGLASTTVAIGAAAVAGGMAAKSAMGSGANALSSGAAGSAGLMQALGAGMASAQDLGKSGIGAAAHAAGQVAGQGLGMAAAGIGSAIDGAAGGFSDKVASSTGAQIASNIESGRGGSMSGASSGASGSSGAAAGPTPASGGGNANAAASSGSGASGGSASAPSGSSSESGGGSTSSSSSGTASTSSSSAPSAPSTSAPTGGGYSGGADVGASVLPTSSASMGDASTASISGGSQSIPSSGPTSDNAPSITDRIKGLEGYVPQDQANISAIQINMGHGKD